MPSNSAGAILLYQDSKSVQISLCRQQFHLSRAGEGTVDDACYARYECRETSSCNNGNERRGQVQSQVRDKIENQGTKGHTRNVAWQDHHNHHHTTRTTHGMLILFPEGQSRTRKRSRGSIDSHMASLSPLNA